MKKILFYILLLSPVLSYSQGKTVVYGTIENAANDSVNLTIDKTYLSQKYTTFKIPVKQNQFSFEFQLDRNRLVELTYQGQKIQLYLETSDSLGLKFKTGSLSESIVFSGKEAIHNQFLKKFNDQFKNNFTTSVMEDKMKSLSLDEFEIAIFDNRKKEKEFYTNYPDKNLFSDPFKKFVDYQIKYSYLDYLLSYPIINANKSNTILTVNPLPTIMLQSVDTNTVSDKEAMISEAYRNYLTYFITYFTSELNGFNKFKDYSVSAEKKYAVAHYHLKGEPFLYYFTNFLCEMGEKINPETVKKIYTEMEKEDKTGDYTGIVKEKLGKWMKTKLPKTADGKLDIASADFKLQGFNGKEISLADFRGKVIYVDFWASWCGPCRQQFPYSKMLHEQLNDKQKKEVVFLYISIDNTEEIWKKALAELQLEGVHALSPGGWTSFVAKYYQISSIPRYLLIDKKGNVVDQNAKRPSEEGTLQDILNLIDQK